MGRTIYNKDHTIVASYFLWLKTYIERERERVKRSSLIWIIETDRGRGREER